MASAIQFFGISNIMEAATNRECPAWGLFIGKALFTKYEGEDPAESMQLLEQTLQAIQRNGTATSGTLKFFEGGRVKITEKTVCDGGQFNFRVFSVEDHQLIGYGEPGGGGGLIGSIKKELEEIKSALAERAAMTGPDPDEEPESVGAVMMDLLRNPEKLGQLVNVGRSLLGMPVQQYGGAPASMGTTRAGESAGDPLERLSAAIDALQLKDPNLVDHMEKLARIATDSPQQFAMLLSMLDR